MPPTPDPPLIPLERLQAEVEIVCDPPAYGPNVVIQKYGGPTPWFPGVNILSFGEVRVFGTPA